MCSRLSEKKNENRKGGPACRAAVGDYNEEAGRTCLLPGNGTEESQSELVKKSACHLLDRRFAAGPEPEVYCGLVDQHAEPVDGL